MNNESKQLDTSNASPIPLAAQADMAQAAHHFIVEEGPRIALGDQRLSIAALEALLFSVYEQGRASSAARPDRDEEIRQLKLAHSESITHVQRQAAEEHTRMRVALETIRFHASGECPHAASEQHFECLATIEKVVSAVGVAAPCASPVAEEPIPEDYRHRMPLSDGIDLVPATHALSCPAPEEPCDCADSHAASPKASPAEHIPHGPTSDHCPACRAERTESPSSCAEDYERARAWFAANTPIIGYQPVWQAFNDLLADVRRETVEARSKGGPHNYVHRAFHEQVVEKTRRETVETLNADVLALVEAAAKSHDTLAKQHPSGPDKMKAATLRAFADAFLPAPFTRSDVKP